MRRLVLLGVVVVLCAAAPRPEASLRQVPEVPPASLQPDRPLAPPAAPGSPQAEEAVRRHRELGIRIAGLLAESERLGRQSSTLLGELRRLDVERQLQQSRADQAAASLSVIEGDLAALEARVASLEATRARETPAVTARLRRLQRLGRVGYARIVWGTSSVQTLGRAARMMTYISREDAARLQGYRVLTAELTRTSELLEGRRQEADEMRATAVRLLQAANAAAAQRRQLLDRIAAERDEQLRVVEELERARTALDGAVASYRATSRPAADGETSPAAPTPSVPLTSQRRRLPWPTPGTVQQRFGRTRHPRFGTMVVRNGIDIAVQPGAAVRAIHGGTVVYADPFDGFGRLVIVDHGDQSFSLYGYLSTLGVTQGTRVGPGEAVGTAGEAPTGGPAVYFELRIDGRPVDPLQWLHGR